MSRTREATARAANVRDEAREPLRPGEAYGRDGKIIRRQSVSDTGNIYSVPQHIIEEHMKEGFVLQWKRVSTRGMEDSSYIAQTARGGWTPVLADRWPGVFLPESHKGAIIIDGQQLMERPLALEQEAVREDRIAAVNQANNSRRNIGIKELAAGFEDHKSSGNAKVRNNSFAKSEMEIVDAPKPKYNYSDVTLD